MCIKFNYNYITITSISVVKEMVTAITATVITPLDVITGVGTVMSCVTVTFIDICKVQCESGTEKYKMLQNISFRLLENLIININLKLII